MSSNPIANRLCAMLLQGVATQSYIPGLTSTDDYLIVHLLIYSDRSLRGLVDSALDHRSLPPEF